MSKTTAYFDEPIVDEDVRNVAEGTAGDLGVDVGLLGVGVRDLAAAAQVGVQFKDAAPFWLKDMWETQERWQRTMNPFGSLSLGLADAAAAGLGRHSDFGFGHELVASALSKSHAMATLQHEHFQARDMAERLGFGRHAAFGVHGSIQALMEAAAPHRLLAERMSAFDSSALQGFQHAVLGLDAKSLSTWAATDHLAKTFGVGNMLSETFDRVGGLARAFQKFLPESTHAPWLSHWRDTALPALSLLARESDRPWGLLMELPNPELGASISWLTRQREQARVSRAALSSDAVDDHTAEVIIECDPQCWICGGPLISLRSTIRWIGPKLGLRNRRVFPACAKCAQAERDDPGFLQRSLPSLERPALGIKREVIKGGGKGDGRPTARLRVVRSDKDSP